MAHEIVLGVTGSIGAYQAADLTRRLKEHGCGVTCVMTKEAREFLTPLTLQALSERRVYTDLFSLEDPRIVHTALAEHAALVLIAPATANLIAKLAHGLADDLLTCLVLATKAPVLIAPAMNVHMYHHPAVQENIKQLRRFGYRFVGPTVGNLACGYEALGHLAEVETVVQTALHLLPGQARVSPPAPAARPPLRRVSTKRPPRSQRIRRR